MGSWSERTTSHIGTEIRPRLLREAAVGEYWTMEETLIQRHRVGDEGFRVVNPFSGGRIRLGGNAHPMTVLQE